MIGSMSGVKIKSAVSNVLTIFDEHIYANDYIMVITFSGEVVVNIPLSKKEGNETAIRKRIAKLILPYGSTGMYGGGCFPQLISIEILKNNLLVF